MPHTQTTVENIHCAALLKHVAPPALTGRHRSRRSDNLQARFESHAERVWAAQPAIAFREAIAPGCCDLDYIAKTLGHDHADFMAWLRRDKILTASGMPYRDYLYRGYFEVVKCGLEKQPSFALMVTGKGQVLLARKYPPNRAPAI